LGSKLSLVNSSTLLADHIVGIYVAAAVANAGLSVTYHTPYAEWLNRIDHGQLTVSNQPPDPSSQPDAGTTIDLNRNYQRQIRHGRARVAWYCANVSPLLRPQRPRGVDRTIRAKRFDFSRYVVVAPGSGPTQRWPRSHWQRFAYLLRSAGFEVVALGARHYEQQVMEISDSGIAFGSVDDRPDWVTDVLLGAAVIVATDDGIAQMGGLLEIPTISVHAQLPPEFLWSFTGVQSVTPDAECSFCRWSTDGGYHPVCESGCSALASISPERLMKALRTILGGSL
jgi:ADP-heptose:LPS heptosyltransferase